jgi:hypothetical protein
LSKKTILGNLPSVLARFQGKDLEAPCTLYEPPLRSELFSGDQREQHGKTPAGLHTLRPGHAPERRSGELDAKIHAITRAGTLRMLDRLEELSRYYEKMKNRYERHIEWLGAQIGSYRADLIELGKEL